MEIEYCKLTKKQVIGELKVLCGLDDLRPIPGFPAYALSSCARLFYVDRSGLICYDCDGKVESHTSDDMEDLHEILFVPKCGTYSSEGFVGRNGYRQAYLYRGKKRTRHPKMIYKLMAITYLSKRPSPNHLVRHLDGNSLNDAASNLAWGTHADNMQDLRKHREERAPLTNELKSEIIKALGRRNRSVDTRKEIADNFNVAFSTVNRLYWKIKDEKAT